MQINDEFNKIIFLDCFICMYKNLVVLEDSYMIYLEKNHSLIRYKKNDYCFFTAFIIFSVSLIRFCKSSTLSISSLEAFLIIYNAV